MKKLRYCFILLLVLALATPMPGWGAKEASAAVEKKAAAAEEVGGRGEGFQPEGKEEAKEEGKKEEAKEDECPATFGPIITDTAIPIEKGKFAVQPTFGLGFVTNSLTQSWRRVSPGAISSPSAWIGNLPTACGTTWKSYG